jgi:hypothetical protein
MTQVGVTVIADQMLFSSGYRGPARVLSQRNTAASTRERVAARRQFWRGITGRASAVSAWTPFPAGRRMGWEAQTSGQSSERSPTRSPHGRAQLCERVPQPGRREKHRAQPQH